MPLRDQSSHSTAALLGDKAEAIPLGLEDPLFVVEGFIDERRKHRSIRGIYASLLCLDRLWHFINAGNPK